MSLRPWDEHVVPRLADLSLRGHEIGELEPSDVAWAEPEARSHFIEHGLAPEPGVQRRQRRGEPVQRRPV